MQLVRQTKQTTITSEAHFDSRRRCNIAQTVIKPGLTGGYDGGTGYETVWNLLCQQLDYLMFGIKEKRPEDVLCVAQGQVTHVYSDLPENLEVTEV